MTEPKIKLLGDVHLGRRWKNGVPLHRRGDRERLQWAEFEANLNDVPQDEASYHIQVGDLFDEAIVPYGVVFRAAQAYLVAAERNPLCHYVLYRGNHDASRDLERVTAFRIFTAIVGDKIMIADEAPLALTPIGGERHVLIPWHPVTTALEMVEQYASLITNADVVYGHWDIDGRQAESTNYIPAAMLVALGVKRAVTGHDHNAREEVIAGLPVTCTGSMQPLDHSQDDSGRFYVTRTLADVLADPDGFKDKHLRVRLEPGEVLDVQIDCLQLALLRDGASEETVALDVEFKEFNFDELLEQAIAEVGLGDETATALRERLKEERVHETD